MVDVPPFVFVGLGPRPLLQVLLLFGIKPIAEVSFGNFAEFAGDSGSLMRSEPGLVIEAFVAARALECREHVVSVEMLSASH